MKILHKSLLGLVIVAQLFGGLAASEKESAVVARDRAEAPARKKTSKKGKDKAAAASKHAASHRDSKMHSVEVKTTFDDEPIADFPLLAAPPASKTTQYAATLAEVCSVRKILKAFVRTGHTLSKHAGKKPVALMERALRETDRADKFVTSYTNEETALRTIADTVFTHLPAIADFLATRTMENSRVFCCKHATAIGYGHDGTTARNDLDESRIVIVGKGKSRFPCTLPSSYPIVSSPRATGGEEIPPLARLSPISVTETTSPSTAAARADTDTSDSDNTPRTMSSHKRSCGFAALLSSDSEN